MRHLTGFFISAKEQAEVFLFYRRWRVWEKVLPHAFTQASRPPAFQSYFLARTSHQLMRSSPEGLRHKRVTDIVSQDNLVRHVKLEGAQLWTHTQASKAVFSSINIIDEKTGLELQKPDDGKVAREGGEVLLPKPLLLTFMRPLARSLAGEESPLNQTRETALWQKRFDESPRHFFVTAQ